MMNKKYAFRFGFNLIISLNFLFATENFVRASPISCEAIFENFKPFLKENSKAYVVVEGSSRSVSDLGNRIFSSNTLKIVGVDGPSHWKISKRISKDDNLFASASPNQNSLTVEVSGENGLKQLSEKLARINDLNVVMPFNGYTLHPRWRNALINEIAPQERLKDPKISYWQKKIGVSRDLDHFKPFYFAMELPNSEYLFAKRMLEGEMQFRVFDTTYPDTTMNLTVEDPEGGYMYQRDLLKYPNEQDLVYSPKPSTPSSWTQVMHIENPIQLEILLSYLSRLDRRSFLWHRVFSENTKKSFIAGVTGSKGALKLSELITAKYENEHQKSMAEKMRAMPPELEKAFAEITQNNKIGIRLTVTFPHTHLWEMSSDGTPDSTLINTYIEPEGIESYRYTGLGYGPSKQVLELTLLIRNEKEKENFLKLYQDPRAYFFFRTSGYTYRPEYIPIETFEYDSNLARFHRKLSLSEQDQKSVMDRLAKGQGTGVWLRLDYPYSSSETVRYIKKIIEERWGSEIRDENIQIAPDGKGLSVKLDLTSDNFFSLDRVSLFSKLLADFRLPTRDYELIIP